MKKKFRRMLATISCAVVGVTSLGLASACAGQPCEHTWNDGEVKTAATCTTDGEMLLTCTKCHETKTETIPMGHNYVDGACSACGGIDPNAAATGNFYFNLIESLATAETYYVEIPECQITVDTEYGETRITCEDLKLTIGVDENGFLCGEGTAEGTITDTLESSEVTCQVRLEDGYIYLTASGVDGDEEHSWDQRDLLERLRSDPQTLAAITLMENVLAAEEWQELADTIKAVEDNPLNTVIKVIFEYVYNKQATNDGYAFTLNASRLIDVYNVFEEQTVGAVFDTVFGSDAYDDVVNYLVSSMDKTIGEVIDEVETKCTEAGVTPETVYSLVNMIANAIIGENTSAEFDISAKLEPYEEMTVVDRLNGFIGEEYTAEKYQEKIQREAANLYNKKLFDTLSAEEKYEIEETLSDLVEELEKVTIQFYTDKAGNLLSVNYELKELDEATIMIESFKMNVVPNGSFAED